MITKESLIRDREQAKVALIRLKQVYKPHSDTYYFIVEGKDDVAFYSCICARYPKLSSAEIIPANNRKNVVDTYLSIDWNRYPKERVLFFIDRDLSEMTNEYTPEDINIYVTDMYSIENSLFNKQLFILTLRVFYRLDDMSPEETTRINELYQSALERFYSQFYPIMCWILNWRMNGIKCNLNNINDGDIYCFDKGAFIIKEPYKEPEAIARFIHKSCGVDYQEQDITEYKTVLDSHGGIARNIRGKYLKTFFVKLLNSVTKSYQDLFPSGLIPKPVVSIGTANALQLLCGYLQIPESLNEFLLQLK